MKIMHSAVFLINELPCISNEDYIPRNAMHENQIWSLKG